MHRRPSGYRTVQYTVCDGSSCCSLYSAVSLLFQHIFLASVFNEILITETKWAEGEALQIYKHSSTPAVQQQPLIFWDSASPRPSFQKHRKCVFTAPRWRQQQISDTWIDRLLFVRVDKLSELGEFEDETRIKPLFKVRQTSELTSFEILLKSNEQNLPEKV